MNNDILQIIKNKKDKLGNSVRFRLIGLKGDLYFTSLDIMSYIRRNRLYKYVAYMNDFCFLGSLLASQEDMLEYILTEESEELYGV